MVSSLSIIGVGAFGEFMLKHLTPYFDVKIYDKKRDLGELTSTYNVTACDIYEAALCDVIVIAVPVRSIESVVKKIADVVQPSQLVVEVASVKSIPMEVLRDNLNPDVGFIGLHPLFGPQSGKHGIHGLNIAFVTNDYKHSSKVKDFLENSLGLNVFVCTADEHDMQMAYVQGLTHMIAKVFQMMNLPEINQETRTFELLRKMVDVVKDDSDELFQAIQTDNPYVAETKDKFFRAVKELESKLNLP